MKESNGYHGDGQIGVTNAIKKAEVPTITPQRYEPKTDVKFIKKIRENGHYGVGNGQSMSWYHFKRGPSQSAWNSVETI